jgi:ribosomal protein S18 acetylase RimI-like enzyme
MGIDPRDEAIILEIQKESDRFDRTHTIVSLEASSGISVGIPPALIAEVGDVPVGFVTLFHPDEYDWELYAAVKPEYRKQGIFSELVGEIRRDLGTHKHRLLFVCNRDSSTGAAVLEHLGLQVERTEYVMELDRNRWTPPARDTGSRYQLRQVGLNDLELIAELGLLCFDEQASISRPFYQAMLADEFRTQYMFLENQKPIGLAAVVKENESFGIFGLGIIPGRRGNGLGRVLLNLVIEKLIPAGRSITLEVDTTNDPALNLYLSNGFQPISTFDYYL